MREFLDELWGDGLVRLKHTVEWDLRREGWRSRGRDG
jgi:hypothetical protein